MCIATEHSACVRSLSFYCFRQKCAGETEKMQQTAFVGLCSGSLINLRPIIKAHQYIISDHSGRYYSLRWLLPP